MIYYFDTLKSTNSVLKEIAKNDTKPFTTVYTTNQTNGRGTFGNSWYSEPYKNLLFSVLIENILPARVQHYLSFWIANCIQEILAKHVSSASVKWPNDIVIRNKKISGILIEKQILNNLNYSIIGVGINVNQEKFEELPNATSLKKETKQSFNIKTLLSDSLSCFQTNFFRLESNFEEILIEYNRHLFQKNKVSAFKQDQSIFNGMIKEVNTNGELVLELENGELNAYRHKQIEFLY